MTHRNKLTRSLAASLVLALSSTAIGSGRAQEMELYGESIETMHARELPGYVGSVQLMSNLAVSLPVSPRVADLPFEVVPGECYAAIGQVAVDQPPRGNRTVDLDLGIFDEHGTLLQTDSTDNSNPVVGGGSHPICPSVAATYRLRVVMDRADDPQGGFVRAQLFTRPRP